MTKKCILCIKITVLVANFSLLLIGLAILGSSIFLYGKTSEHDTVRAPDHYSEFKKILCYIMGIGTFTTIVSLIGCLGGYYESQVVLSFYFVGVLLLFASEVAVGALYIVYKDEKMTTNLRISIDKYNAQKIERQEELFLDNIQKMLKCCGVNGVDDFKMKDSSDKLPYSCCNYERFQCMSISVDKPKAFTKGCKEQYKEFSRHKLGIISTIISIMSAIEFLGMTFSVALCFSIRYNGNGDYEPVKRSFVA